MFKFLFGLLLATTCSPYTISIICSGEDPALIQMRHGIQEVLVQKKLLPVRGLHLHIKNARNSPFVLHQLLKKYGLVSDLCVLLGAYSVAKNPNTQWVFLNIDAQHPITTQNVLYQKNILTNQQKVIKEISCKYPHKKIGLLAFDHLPRIYDKNVTNFVIHEPEELENMLAIIHQSDIGVLYIAPSHLLYSALPVIQSHIQKKIITYFDTKYKAIQP